MANYIIYLKNPPSMFLVDHIFPEGIEDIKEWLLSRDFPQCQFFTQEGLLLTPNLIIPKKPH